MSALPPRPTTLSYASPRATSAATGQASWRTLAAAGYLILVLLLLLAAYGSLTGDQDAWGNLFLNLFSGSTAMVVLLPLALSCFGPAAWTFGIGAVAMVLLWHWPRRWALWLALLPGSMGIWHVVLVMANGPATAAAMAAPLAVAAAQALFLCGGAWFGRWIFRGIARLLLPPGLAGELIALWRH